MTAAIRKVQNIRNQYATACEIVSINADEIARRLASGFDSYTEEKIRADIGADHDQRTKNSAALALFGAYRAIAPLGILNDIDAVTGALPHQRRTPDMIAAANRIHSMIRRDARL